MKREIYLDHAATTAVKQEVLEEMLPWLGAQYGNPSSVYQLAGKSKQAIAQARRSCAALIGARPQEICFTSGGTEADNQALIGAVLLWKQKHGGSFAAPGGDSRPHVITSRIEHPAVLETCRFLEEMGCEVTYLSVDGTGRVNPAAVEDAIRPGTCLISIMTANNELGCIEPIKKIGAIAREHNILFHTDAVQAYGHIPLDVQDLQVDLLSASAHKLGGPKGVGLLYIKAGLQLPQLLHGGGQERGRRAGTENVAGIAGFGRAAQLAGENMTERMSKVRSLRNYMREQLIARIPDIQINAPAGIGIDIKKAADADTPERFLPGTVHVSIPDVHAETLLILLDQEGICASAGSACSSGALEPSHVLQAIGLRTELLRSSLRFSLGEENTKEDIGRAVGCIVRNVEKLRGRE